MKSVISRLANEKQLLVCIKRTVKQVETMLMPIARPTTPIFNSFNINQNCLGQYIYQCIGQASTGKPQKTIADAIQTLINTDFNDELFFNTFNFIFLYIFLGIRPKNSQMHSKQNLFPMQRCYI